MMIQPTNWQQMQQSTHGNRRSNFEAPHVTEKVMTIAAPQIGMVISCAFEDVQPNSVRIEVMKEDIAAAVKSQQKKHIVNKWMRQSSSTYW